MSTLSTSKETAKLRPVGRPPLPSGEATKKYTVCLKKSEADTIRMRYGDLSKFVRLMLEEVTL